MSGYRGHLACPRCGLAADENRFVDGCPACADEGVPVNVHPVYDFDHGPIEVDPAQPGLFRFRSMLPLPSTVPPVSLGEGGTALLHLERLGARLGLRRLYLKDESRNPTWSYKDRLAAVAVTKARADDADTVVVSTTGNHGAAAAAYAAAAGLRCIALTLASVPTTMKVLMQSYGAQVVALEHPPDRWRLMRLAAAEWGWVPLSGLLDPPAGSNPFGIDGYKTIAYELADQLDGLPDVVIVPVAYGDGLAGIARGFADLVAVGQAARMPRMVAAEPLGPYSATLASGTDRTQIVPARPSVAFSTAGTMATYQGLAALRGTGGEAVVVGDDDRTLAAQLAVGGSEGIYLEASAATALVAAEDLADRGRLGPDDVVVAVGTSSGLKDVAATAAHLTPVPVVEPSLAALQAALT